jgi:threonine dehydrogenase-like Zn-dependent dehydrogenase
LGAIAGCHFAGARTIAIDVDDAKLEIARKAGASHTINSRKASLHKALLDFTDGFGPGVVIEAIGSPETFQAAAEEVSFCGRVVYIGYAKERVSYETRLFVQKELDILGSRNAMPDDFHRVIKMLERGMFPVEDAVTAVVPLEEAPQALQEWSGNPSRFTKIMVSLS